MLRKQMHDASGFDFWVLLDQPAFTRRLLFGIIFCAAKPGGAHVVGAQRILDPDRFMRQAGLYAQAVGDLHQDRARLQERDIGKLGHKSSGAIVANDEAPRPFDDVAHVRVVPPTGICPVAERGAVDRIDHGGRGFH
jgi:hypothetical protein